VLLGHGENSIYQIHQELQGKFSGYADTAMPTRGKGRSDVWPEHTDPVIFHAAAPQAPADAKNAEEAVPAQRYGHAQISEVSPTVD
jgi:FlaA1/EpsC-like NDP-sugar epimerase